MTGDGALRWLHLSDLHLGCRGEEVWRQVRSEFKDSIRKHFRPIDLILVTGDLTFRGLPGQFDLFDRFSETCSAGCAMPGRWTTLSSFHSGPRQS